MRTDRSRSTAKGITLVALAALLVAGCGPATAGSAAPGPQGGRSASVAANRTVPGTAPLPPGTLGAPNGHGPMVNVSVGATTTSVRSFDRATHAQLRTVELPGRWRLPVVTTTGPVEGFARNATMVVLAEAPPAGTSRFAVLGTTPDAPPRIVELPGGFSYDALAPDGSRLYVLEHLGPAGSEHYQVRSYDLAAQRLNDAVVVDKTHLDEQMAGHPTSRVTSADGSVVATMYERTGGAPFIHVLHTLDGSAQCIDLPALAGGLHLAGTGSIITLQDAAGPARLTVDLSSGTVSGPAGQCTGGVTRDALPQWARTGFSGDGSGVPHVTSTRGDMIAVLFAFPLNASADPTITNKILWIPRTSTPPATGQPPSAEPTALDGLHLTADLVGTPLTMTRTIPDGPGPSSVNFRRAGCWHLTCVGPVAPTP